MKLSWRRKRPGLVWCIGWIALLAVANEALGVLWAETRPETSAAAGPVRDYQTADSFYRRFDVDIAAPASGWYESSSFVPPGMERSPAMRSAAWRSDLARRQRRARLAYAPFLNVRVRDLDEPDVRVARGIRRSWTSPDAASAGHRAVVWVLGGGAVWGEGQRDGHTIASELARLAARSGAPIDVVNLGVPTYTNYQAVLRFEQELAVAPRPDVAVFYDGANDLGLQTSHPSAQPTAAPTNLTLSPPPEPSLYERWADNSLVTLLWRRLARAVEGDAAAEVASATSASASGVDPALVAADVLAVYRQGTSLARTVAARHAVKTLFFWQPAAWFSEAASWPAVRRGLPALGIVDLSTTFDGVTGPIYIDQVQTNELGARLAARAMWRDLAPALGREAG